MSLSRGERIGAYQVIAKLGEGGMGDVYRAHDARLGRDVALKILPADVAADHERLERFRREARAVAALNHPHIVTIFSIEEDGGVPFMTMELIEGQPLDRLIGGSGVSLGQFFEVGIAIADALAAAHRKGLVHRDVKPANVMVTDAGLVKVLDFGLARESEAGPANEDGATLLGLTQAGMIVGTVPYMSPEQIESRPVDHRSDIFSAGVVLYEMLAGARPFTGGSSPALMSSILKDRPRPLRDARRDVPETLGRLVARCLEKSTDDRIQSAQDLLIELRAIRRTWESGTVAPAPASGSDARPASSDLRVAVLPFTSRGSGDAEALAEGLTDDITAGLSRFAYLRVVSRTEVEKATGQSADAAAGTVRARFLLDGAVRTSGTAARVSVRLVDTASQSHIWAENFDRTLSSDTVFTVQDDVAARIIAPVGDSAGVLIRSMAAVLKERDADELSVGDLVVRFYGFLLTFRADEHERLRAAFERALEREPNNALGWAVLAQLYEQEHSQQLNPRPQPLERSARAAERAVEHDPACQNGWLSLAVVHFLNRDGNALRMAGERAVACNPFETAMVAYVGLLRAYAGDWDHGLAIVRRTMELNPRHHPGWLYYVLAVDHYRRGDYERTLLDAQRSNLPQFIWTHLCAIVAAGQLGRVDEARAGFDGLRKIDPRFLETDAVRQVWSQWTWDHQLLDRLMDGFAKAKALVEGPGPASSQAGRPWPLLNERGASIAVMPFSDLSPAGDQEWFCDGIAEEILNALAPLKNLRVAARASAFSLRGRSDDLTTIGDKLNVTTVLSGSVRRAADRVRITVQLSEVATGFQLWSARYDRELRDIFDVQDEIATSVADRLKVSLSDDPLDRLAQLVERGTTDVEAYQRYLRGRALLLRRGGDIAKAIPFFREAVALDPSYALAWSGIADAHGMLVYYGLARGAESKTQAMAAATRAIELEPSLAAGHASLAFAVLMFEQDLERVEREFERALELNPRYVQGRCWYALFYLQWTRGRFAQGVAHARRALEDDPLSAYPTMMLAGCLQAIGPLDEALAAARAAVDRDPESFGARWILGATLALTGRADEALATYQAAAGMTESPVAQSGLAFAYAQAGKTADARRIYDELAERAATRFVPLAFLASAAASCGRIDEAVALARQAWHDREPTFILWARHYHEYRGLRSDPRFQAILREMDAQSG